MSTPTPLDAAIRAASALEPADLTALRGWIEARLTASADPALSEREVLIVRLIALGYSNKEIARRLKLSVKTVETYKSRAMEKLKTRSRVALVRYAHSRGWLTAVLDDEPAPQKEMGTPPDAPTSSPAT